jgi:hypothetical protein
MAKLERGLYEQLITETLAGDLADLSDAVVGLGIAPDRLSSRLPK